MRESRPSGPAWSRASRLEWADGHHLVNRTEADVVYLEVGDRPPVDDVDYPDIDMLLRGGRVVRRDGAPY